MFTAIPNGTPRRSSEIGSPSARGAGAITTLAPSATATAHRTSGMAWLPPARRREYQLILSPLSANVLLSELDCGARSAAHFLYASNDAGSLLRRSSPAAQGKQRG